MTLTPPDHSHSTAQAFSHGIIATTPGTTSASALWSDCESSTSATVSRVITRRESDSSAAANAPAAPPALRRHRRNPGATSRTKWSQTIRKATRREPHPNWITAVRAADPPRLQAFTRGLDFDKAAVQAALTLPLHNGGTEGVNTKTKRIMRQMQGFVEAGPLGRSAGVGPHHRKCGERQHGCGLRKPGQHPRAAGRVGRQARRARQLRSSGHQRDPTDVVAGREPVAEASGGVRPSSMRHWRICWSWESAREVYVAPPADMEVVR